MPQPCTYKFVSPSSNPQKAGAQITLALDPQLKPGCNIGSASADGGFKVVGLGASGTVTIEAREDNPKGSVTVTVQCEDCGPTTLRLAIPEDEIAKLKRELIDSKRELIKQLDETIKEAEAVIQADEAKKKAGLLAPHSSEEAADRERVTRLKKEKIDVMEMLVKELEE
jgi:hypothetical protein